ncbi:MAG: hypothetical protein B6D77_15330 [gamma proteobacterium symbiont of Ctena orbiculata]|nr:MAG: hypothetical protein B6D77_15330 [gamma proteobacterium symbiont of Ctena orbiculata]PVV24067.1 MAG: hypothetical protein B6D78_02095 [gamma proteobacterium symbiont of Ctena orbiculata]
MQFYSTVKVPLRHDAPYAWYLRDAAEYNPNYRKKHLAELDDRLNAFLECLLANETWGDSVLPKIRMTDWGAVFTVAYVAIMTNNKSAFLQALEAVEKEQQSRELSDALCRADFKTIKPYLLEIAHHDNPWIQVAVIKVVGHHLNEVDRDWLLPHLNSESNAVRLSALKLIGDRGLVDYTDSVREHFDHEEASLRFQATYSGILLGIDGAYKSLLHFCFSDNPYLRKALGLVHHLHDISAIKRAIPRIHNGNFSLRIKAYNIAMAGLPDWVHILLEWMNYPEYAQLAGEAFCFITGADLDADDLILRDQKICEDHEIPLAQKRKLDPWTQAYEEDLPWPDPDAVATWWEANRQRFEWGTRYLAGRSVTEENLQQVMQDSTQPQRHQAELILRLLHIKAN